MEDYSVMILLMQGLIKNNNDMLSKLDIDQLEQKGINKNIVLQQIERFKTGFEQLDVLRPAIPNNGIKILDAEQQNYYSKLYIEQSNKNLSVAKFVPASGAATRMFKDLYQFINNPAYFDELPENHPIRHLIEFLPDFAFFPLLQDIMKDFNLNDINVRKSKSAEIINIILKGLNYGNLPKGLVHFHSYSDGAIRTAMEEHLTEGRYYVADGERNVKVHFTVSPEHNELFRAKLNQKVPAIEKEFKISFGVEFSFQKSYTDTIAVTPDNEPFRDKDGNLVFRPGGHGALIENLNDVIADVIFIKNIDNVVREHLINDTVIYKKTLGGLLLSLRNNIFEFLKKLNKTVDENLISEIEKFIKNELFTSLPKNYYSLLPEKKADYLQKYLNRPIRVCGMVRNEGEPGGGPFWVREKSGQETLQILESSQLDLSNPHQAEQLKNATHFNPVDLVCSTKDYKENKFNLTDFSDPETGFISEKSVNGQVIKALELPGLWNGAMANWITLFVEVPITTFNPVKTVNDLLRLQHQP